MCCWVVSSLGRYAQKFVAFFLLVSFLALPVSAADTEYVSRDTFWNWAAGSNGVVKQVINFVGGMGTCSKSEDTYHHASSYFKEGNVGGEIRYRCICDLCGDSFTAYEKDLQQSYDAQVEELPAPGYQSDGSLLWSPAHDYMVNYSRYYADNPSFCNHYSGTTESHIAGGVIVESGNNFVITASSGQGNFKTYQILLSKFYNRIQKRILLSKFYNRIRKRILPETISNITAYSTRYSAFKRSAL